MPSKLANSITYRFNVLYDYNAARKAWSAADAAADKQCWDVMEGELLVNVTDAQSHYKQRPRMACLTNTAGLNKGQDWKFAGISLGNMSHNDRMMPQGFAAAREGTFSITHTGAQHIQAGQDVYAYIDNNNTAAHNIRGVPRDKKLLVTCNASCAGRKNARHVGKALSTAQQGQLFDILVC